MKKYYISIAIVWVVSAFAILAYQVTTGDDRSDKKTISDLQTIQGKMYDYTDKHKALPQTLQDMDIDQSVKDKNYEYNILSDSMYELCGVFKSDTRKNDTVYDDEYSVPDKHKAGRQCFKLSEGNLKPLENTNTDTELN